MSKRASDETYYNKYSNIIQGSIELTAVGKEITSGKNKSLISKGRICIIQCEEADFNPRCRKTRIINLQDARQVKKCLACTRRDRNKRRRLRRKANEG